MWGCLGFRVNTTPRGVVRDGSRIHRQKPLNSSATRACGAASPSLHRVPRHARQQQHRSTHGSNATEHPTRTTGTGTTRASDQQGEPTSMSSVRPAAGKKTTTRDIPMQPASADIWDKKYRLNTQAGEAVDAALDGPSPPRANALSDPQPPPH